jgi:ankyrin repeat protein
MDQLEQLLRDNDIDKVKEFLKGKNVNGEMLWIATYYGRCIEIIRPFCENGLKSVIKEEYNRNGRTALYNITNTGFLELAKLFLENGSNANDTEHVHSCSCLRNAIFCENIELVKLLLEYGATIGEDDTGLTEIDNAGLLGNTDILYMLLDRLDINEVEPEKRLIYAAWKGDINEVNMLLAAGVELRGKSSELTAKEMSEMFIDGCDFSYKGYAGILVHAAKHNHLQMVKFLLERGEDPTQMDEMGRLALDVTKNEEIKMILLDYGA